MSSRACRGISISILAARYPPAQTGTGGVHQGVAVQVSVPRLIATAERNKDLLIVAVALPALLDDQFRLLEQAAPFTLDHLVDVHICVLHVPHQ